MVRPTIYGNAGSLRWIQISHVCKRWRMVAIGCTRLWSDLNFSSPCFAAIMLERSRNAPLHVKYNTFIHGEQSHAILSDVLSHSDRLKSVELCNNRLPYPTLLSAMGKSAPLLEKLAISVGYSSSLWVLPEDFTMGEAPSLKHLEILDFDIRWDNIPLGRALTTLHLDTQSIGSSKTKWLLGVNRVYMISSYLPRASFRSLSSSRLCFKYRIYPLRVWQRHLVVSHCTRRYVSLRFQPCYSRLTLHSQFSLETRTLASYSRF